MLDLQTQRLIRKSTFSKKNPLNQNLMEIVRYDDRHAFLVNPASQNTYVYLTDYVKEFSEKWFGKSFSQIQVLDWGCGKGHITFLLKSQNSAVTSCDIEDDSDDSSFGQVTPIIQQAGIQVLPLKHAYTLPFKSDSFEVVLSFGVLEHVPNDLESLKELHRVLQPNGLFFCFFLPTSYSWTQKIAHLRGDTYHDRLYTKASAQSLLKQSGFEMMDFWYRALFPKNTVRYRNYRLAEKIDQLLCEKTFLKHFATNFEFVAKKKLR